MGKKARHVDVSTRGRGHNEFSHNQLRIQFGCARKQPYVLLENIDHEIEKWKRPPATASAVNGTNNTVVVNPKRRGSVSENKFTQTTVSIDPCSRSPSVVADIFQPYNSSAGVVAVTATSMSTSVTQVSSSSQAVSTLESSSIQKVRSTGQFMKELRKTTVFKPRADCSGEDCELKFIFPHGSVLLNLFMPSDKSQMNINVSTNCEMVLETSTNLNDTNSLDNSMDV